jgi:hypothetical protein
MSLHKEKKLDNNNFPIYTLFHTGSIEEKENGKDGRFSFPTTVCGYFIYREAGT